MGNLKGHQIAEGNTAEIFKENVAVTIDFANICKAPKEYDIARTYFLLKEDIKGRSAAELYLAKMQMEYGDIRAYINVLEALRKYENILTF